VLKGMDTLCFFNVDQEAAPFAKNLLVMGTSSFSKMSFIKEGGLMDLMVIF
jgi:hypothetical protein